MSDRRLIYTPCRSFENISIETCKDGNLTARIKNNGKALYIHSKYNPLREAVKFAEEAKLKGNSIVVCFGFGLGHHIRELLKRCTRDNIIIVYEPCEELFTKIVDDGLCDDLLSDSRIFVFAGKSTDKFREILTASIKTEDYTQILPLEMPDYGKIFEEAYRGFLYAVDKTIRIKNVEGSTIYFNRMLWTGNLFINIETINESYNIKNFENAVKGKPVFVVSAGPSLNKNVEVLKRVKGKALIVCVFVAAKVLLKNGIVPDIIVSADARQTGLTEETKDIPLAYIPVVAPEFLNEHTGKKILITSKFEGYTEKLFKKYNKEFLSVETGGSVACETVDMAYKMGADPIVLVGQDLAFTEGKFHADGTDHAAKTIDEVERERILVKSVDGGMVSTEPAMYSYIIWFEEYINSHKKAKFIDATEGGAYIKGTELMPLNDVCERYLKDENIIATETLLDECFSKGKIFTDEEKEQIRKETLGFTGMCEELEKEAKRAVELSNKLIKNLKFSSNTKQAEKIVRDLKEIDKSFQKFDRFKWFVDFITNAHCIYDNVINKSIVYNEVTYKADRLLQRYSFLDKTINDILKIMKGQD